MEEITLPSKIKHEEINNTESVIIIEPCYPGYGTTLGNALRRVLISSLSGAAVTAVKIKGVDHEFSTIDNIKEDVVEIIMNLKSLHAKLFSDEPVKLKLKSKGKRNITASDFEKSSDAEIVNGDLLIARATSNNSELDMEITLEKGRGYQTTEQKISKDMEIGTILVDSIFSPVLNVGYSVENIRVGKRTDFDKLILNIKTSGIIAPIEAFQQAAQILVDQFLLLSKPQEVMKKTQEEEKKEVVLKEQDQKEGDSTPVQELNFSTRTFNALSKAKIRTAEDLVKKTKKELLTLEGLGQTALNEIEKSLKKLNLELKD
jgi:DNA-directed RNA polymerase subunit alpha